MNGSRFLNETSTWNQVKGDKTYMTTPYGCVVVVLFHSIQNCVKFMIGKINYNFEKCT
jgi:hypothetical protein